MKLYNKFLELEKKHGKQIQGIGNNLLVWVQDENFPIEPHYIADYENVEFDPEIHTFILSMHLISDANGIYIPQIFSEFDKWENITAEDKKILSDPYDEDYWEVWESVLTNTFIIVDDLKYNAEYIDGNLCAVHYIED